jgi:hypothetical protein
VFGEPVDWNVLRPVRNTGVIAATTEAVVAWDNP